MAGPGTITLPARPVVVQLMSVEHPPSSSVKAKGKAGEADKNQAEPLRIAEYYRPECHPEDAR